MTLAGTRLFATALPLGLTASRLTHSCAYHGLRLCFFLRRVAAWTAGAAVPTHMSEVQGSVRPTLACSSNRSAPVAWMTVAVSYSKDDVGERPFSGRIVERMRDRLQALCTAESP